MVICLFYKSSLCPAPYEDWQHKWYYALVSFFFCISLVARPTVCLNIIWLLVWRRTAFFLLLLSRTSFSKTIQLQLKDGFFSSAPFIRRNHHDLFFVFHSSFLLSSWISHFKVIPTHSLPNVSMSQDSSFYFLLLALRPQNIFITQYFNIFLLLLFIPSKHTCRTLIKQAISKITLLKALGSFPLVSTCQNYIS